LVGSTTCSLRSVTRRLSRTAIDRWHLGLPASSLRVLSVSDVLHQGNHLIRISGKDTILSLPYSATRLGVGLEAIYRWTIAPSARRPSKRSRMGSCRCEVLTARRAAPGAMRRARSAANQCD